MDQLSCLTLKLLGAIQMLFDHKILKDNNQFEDFYELIKAIYEFQLKQFNVTYGNTFYQNGYIGHDLDPDDFEYISFKRFRYGKFIFQLLNK
ncbi:unnamed protein product [Adineta steineri]|uniref:Uncharacterized protein n=1 Tax=Adineta steineri TaxID=433720 RepID=A0A815U1N5_9BILA|nr:unnamed protein product [Adineta steineri]CAF1647978.1 unnamed protein product [Adineta steineri]